MESESLGPKANPQIMDREHITRELECGELRGQKSIKKSSKHLLKKMVRNSILHARLIREKKPCRHEIVITLVTVNRISYCKSICRT